MDSQTLLQILLAVGIMLLVGFPVHEFSHAFAAFRLGDSTARWQGRLTLDPRVHFDPVGGFMLIISAVISSGAFFFGYAKPTPVNPMNLSGGHRGEALVSLAGPLSNLLMAAIMAIPIRLVLGSDALWLQVQSGLPHLLFMVAYYFVLINVFLCVFNLIPVPPLDGWRALLGLVSPRTAWQLRGFEQQYAQIIPFLFLLIIFTGIGSRILSPITDFLLRLLLGIG